MSVEFIIVGWFVLISIIAMALFRKGSRKKSVDNSEELKEELRSLRSRFLSKDTSNDFFPIAMWTKTVKGVIISMNNTCYETFIEHSGHSYQESIGATDHDLFEKEIADNIVKNDTLVLESKEPISFIENINGVDWVVIRIPVMNIENTKPILLKGFAYKKTRHEKGIL